MNSTRDVSESIEYDPERGVYRVEDERNECKPSYAFLRAIAAIEEVETSDLEPLGRIVDVGGLNSVLRSSFDDGDINFSYHGYRATFCSDGDIVLDPADSDAKSSDTVE